MIVAAIGRAVMGMPSHSRTALDGAEGSAGTVTEAAVVVVAAVSHAVMGMPSHSRTALDGTQRRASAPADLPGMVGAVMAMSTRDSAAPDAAARDSGNGSASMMSAAVMASMSGDRRRHQDSRQETKEQHESRTEFFHKSIPPAKVIFYNFTIKAQELQGCSENKSSIFIVKRCFFLTERAQTIKLKEDCCRRT